MFVPQTADSLTALALDSLAATVSMMMRVRACRGAGLSPDGRRVAFISDITGIPQVWITDVEGGWPELVTALDDPIIHVAWSPEGSWLAFVLAPGGGMNCQVYLVRPDGTAMRRITDGGNENNWLKSWTRDGTAVSIASNRRTASAMDAYVIDTPSGDIRFMAQSNGIGFFTDVSRDGRHAVLFREEQRSDSNLFLVELGSRTEVCLTPHAGPGNFGGGRFAPEGQVIYLSSDLDRDLSAFGRVVLDQHNRPGQVEILAARDDAALQEFAITEDGTTAALVWNVAGRSDLVFLDLRTLKVTPGPTLPPEVIGGSTFSKDGRLLAMSGSGSTWPADVWVVERTSGNFWQVTRSPHPGIDLRALVRPEMVEFAAHDGVRLTGWLYGSRQFRAPGPIVLSFHGGPESQERPAFDSTYQGLLALGIGVFAPNVRGSSGFGKTFANLDNGSLRVNAIKDIETCVNYVIESGIAAPSRIGIMGTSYGGYMALAGLSEYPALFSAGATLAGIVNFETFFAHTEPWMAAISRVEYGDPETQRDLLKRLSPIHKIDRVIAPVLVLHGANDTNVPVVEAEQIVHSLRRRHVPVEFVLFGDEGHAILKLPNRIRAAVSIVRWFATHLKLEPHF